MRPIVHSKLQEYRVLARKIKALAHPTRLQLLATLQQHAKRKLSVAELFDLVETTTSNQGLGQHLSLLVASDYVKKQRIGRTVYVSLDDTSDFSALPKKVLFEQLGKVASR
jgi:DNA-binding transcriptional ArsR family regulator